MPGVGVGVGLVSRRGGVATAWTPAALSGLVEWWEPSADTVSSSSASLVPTGDGSPGGYVFGRVASYPLGRDPLPSGNRPTIRLSDADGVPNWDRSGGTDGGSSYNQTPATLFSTACSFFVLVRVNDDLPPAGTDSIIRFDNSVGGNPLMDILGTNGAEFRMRVRNAAGTLVSSPSVNAALQGQWAVLSATWDGTSGAFQVWKNGVSIGTGTVTGTCTVDRCYPSNSAPAIARYGAILVYSRALTTDERGQVEAYLSDLVSSAVAETIPATAVGVSTLAGYDTEFDANAAGVLTLAASPATDGGFVDSWAKTAGAVAAVTEATNRPTMRVESGVNVVEFPGTGTPRLGASFSTRTMTKLTFYAVARVTTQTAEVGGLAAFGSNNSGNPYFSPAGGGSSPGTSTVQFSLINNNEPCNNVTRDQHWHVWAATYDPAGSLWRFFVDGAEISGLIGGGNGAVPVHAATGFTTFPWDHVGFGYRSGTARPCGFRVVNLTVATECHTPRQVRQATQGFRSRYSALFGSYTTDPLVLWLGASNLLDPSGGGGLGIPNATAALTSAYTRFYVLARGSQTSLLAARRVRHEVPHLIAGVTGRTVACLYIGGNDFTVGYSDAQIQSYVSALFAELRRAGVDKIVAGTQLPRTSASNVARATYNAWLATRVGVTIDGIADMAANTTIGEDGDNANTTYYEADGIHLKAAGCAVAAPIWRAAIEAALA